MKFRRTFLVKITLKSGAVVKFRTKKCGWQSGTLSWVRGGIGTDLLHVNVEDIAAITYR